MRILLTIALLLVAGPAWAQTGVTVKQSTCTATWTAPQTNADGTNLADLKEYGVYVGVALNAMTTITAVVPAPAADPAAGATATWPCKSLVPGSYFIQVDAVDTSGNRSARTAAVPFVLIPDPDVVPPSAPGVPVVAGP